MCANDLFLRTNAFPVGTLLSIGEVGMNIAVGLANFEQLLDEFEQNYIVFCQWQDTGETVTFSSSGEKKNRKPLFRVRVLHKT